MQQKVIRILCVVCVARAVFIISITQQFQYCTLLFIFEATHDMVVLHSIHLKIDRCIDILHTYYT